ncbi:cytochrome oxidase c subunit VIb-domain-containing protein [Pyronema domesticum]|nr:cytochrome oxidase c subunit VIb-domain-containing protein [Pyronema domesticum]
MGLFGTSTTKSTEPETKIAPNRSQRAKCWEARDAFFECLDRNSIIDSVKEDKKAKEVCGGENVKFEKECVASWVEYFKKRRVMEYNRDQMMKGLQNEGAQQVAIPDPVGQAQVSPK